MVYASRTPVLAQRPTRRLSQEARLLSAILAALAIAAAGLIYVHEAGMWFADSSDATLTSFAVAAAASLPLLWVAYRSVSFRWARVAIMAWLPLKALLLWGAPNKDVMLGTGDNMAWDHLAISIANFWRAGGDWIPSTAFLHAISVIYPGSVPLFGLPYLVFENQAYAVVPWLGFFQLASACCMPVIAARTKLPPKAGGLMLLYMLFCPAWLSLTNTLFRDMLLFFGLVVALIGILYLRERRIAVGLFATAIGVTVTLSLRMQYVVFFPAFGLFAALVGRLKLVKLVLLFLALLLAASVLVNHFRPDADSFVLGRGAGGSTELRQDDRGGSFVALFASVTPYSFPVAIPFRLLTAIVAPFPWVNGELSLSDQSGNWWVYAALHISQAVLHLAIIIMLLVTISVPARSSVLDDRGVLLLLIYGVGLIMAGTVATVGF